MAITLSPERSLTGQLRVNVLKPGVTMYNPDFWEVQFEQSDLEQFSNEANIWYETGEDREARYHREDRTHEMTSGIYGHLSEFLTQKQCEVVILYYMHQKTQQDIAEILGISRRVVSQHLFGIHRNGKHVGGAMNNLRRLCDQQDIDFETAEPPSVSGVNRIAPFLPLRFK